MEANPNYWQGVPAIKRIIYQVVPELANRVALLQQGKVDLVEGLSPDEAVGLATAPGVRVAAVRGNQSIYLVMNNSKPPFDNEKVRQAIDYAIPRDQIVADIYRGLAVKWEGVMPSVYPGYVEFSSYKTDIAKSKQLMQEAGAGAGFPIMLSVQRWRPGAGEYRHPDEVNARPAEHRGRSAKLPVAAHSDLVQSKKADFALWIDFPIQPDPNYSLRLLYFTGNAVNYQNYQDPEVDRILTGRRLHRGHRRAQRGAQTGAGAHPRCGDTRLDRRAVLRECDERPPRRLEVVHHPYTSKVSEMKLP